MFVESNNETTCTHQTDPSPCCQHTMMLFPSGGSNIGTIGAYVMCIACYKEYPIDYKSGFLK